MLLITVYAYHLHNISFSVWKLQKFNYSKLSSENIFFQNGDRCRLLQTPFGLYLPRTMLDMALHLVVYVAVKADSVKGAGR